jgi:hypothetical protein
MNGPTNEPPHRPEGHQRRARTLEHQTWELRRLEHRIATGEHLNDVLEECAQRLNAMELADGRDDN